jgi:glycosyltransferase involved in cell wall biosynthesis
MTAATASPRIALVVPCFNEAERLDAGAFIAFARERADRRLCFVDDGSTDATAARLAEIAAAVPDRVDVERLPTNRGKGAAVRAGLRAQLARAPRYVGYWDADLATPLPFVETLAAHLDAHADLAMAIGSRVLMLGRPITRHTTRHYLGRVAATLVSLVLHAPIYDSQCGAKLLRNGPALAALLDAPFATRWLFDVEILDRIARAEPGAPAAVLHRRVHEVPVPEWADAPGSKVRLRDWLRVPLDLARIWHNRRAL